ncbi:hypothetical protein [Dongia sp.]|uniref:hypothetical protein n=1 Tax=Dongia sp. TaxID=1977262 RepID=UPI0035B24D58
MSRDNRDRLFNPIAGVAKRPPYTPLGRWDGATFAFDGPEQEREWHAQAYRQSVHPDRWQTKPPVDAQTQSLLDDMPHLGTGQFFRGPDGKHRSITAALREDRDVQAIRGKAFNDFARTGVTWTELGQYPDDKPHPGEAEALALAQGKRGAASKEQEATYPNKTRDMGAQPNERPDLTRVAGDVDLDLDLTDDAAAWGSLPKEPAQPPVLVASTDRAVTGLPKEVKEAQPFIAPPSLPSGQRRAYNEKLVGYHANDNYRSVANDNSPGVAGQGAAKRIDRQAEEKSPGKPIIAGAAMAEEEERQIDDRLFNWKRKGYPEPAPSEYAIHAASDAGRFAYLEDMKDEWSRLLEQNPDAVFRSMQGEVDKLSNVALTDFHTAYHEAATPKQVAEIKDAVAKIVFAPAQHWTEAGIKPNETVAASKPFLGLIRPLRISGADLSDVFFQAATVIAEEETYGGRLGSKETRDIAELMTKKLAAAIQACGGQVQGEFYGRKEKFIPKTLGQFLGGSYSDGHVPFTINGRSIGLFANHSATYADGITLKPNEVNQIYKLVNNIARGIREGDLDIEAAGIGHFSKRKPGQSMEDYLKAMDDFVNKMVDCKRPFLIKVAIEKASEVSELLSNDN